MVGGDWISSSVQSTLDALQAPVAILARSGVVIAANEAWRAASCDNADLSCPEGDNYLDWCRTFGGEDGAGRLLARAVGRVLDGARTSWEQTFHAPGAAVAVSLRVQRIEDQRPPRFLVVQEVADATLDEDLEDRVLNAQMQERTRLAGELHDSVGQNLVCLGLSLARIRRLSPGDPDLATIVEDMAESLQHAHAEIRTLSFLLHPPWDEAKGAFEQAVRDLVGGFARRAGLHATVEVSGRSRELCRTRELTLFRILQEALVNIHRHAQADGVQVALSYHSKHVVLMVRDDGRGIVAPEGAPPPPGVGILGMRARLQRFGGDLAIVSGRDGTTLTAKLPV